MSNLIKSEFDDSGFEKKLGLEQASPIIAHQEVSEEKLAEYAGILPNHLLRFWQKHGWGGFQNGALWMVDPECYRDLVVRLTALSQLENADENFVIMRGPFGDLEIWNRYRGQVFTYHPHTGQLNQADLARNPIKPLEDLGIQMWTLFRATSLEDYDKEDEKDKLLFARALKKLGPLKANEMYGFVAFLSKKCNGLF